MARVKHEKSAYLEEFENQRIFQLLNNETSIATGIVQLWLSQMPEHREWKKAGTGVICLVNDSSKNLNYFRLYNTAPTLLWTQEIYINLTYKAINDNFYFFPADECNAGFNFAFVDEAKKFHFAVAKVLSSYKNPGLASPPAASIPRTNPLLQINNTKIDKSKMKMKVKKDVISGPMNCEHVFGYELAISGNIEGVEDENMKMFMEILQQFNARPEGKKMIKEAKKQIKENGGLENFKSVYKKRKESIKSFNLDSSQNRPAPDIPNKTSSAVRAPPPPPSPFSSAVPPPPAPPPPPPTPLSIGSNPIERKGGSAPPPPPPDPFDNLLKSITNFNQNALKSVEKTEIGKEKAVDGDIVNGLMDALIKMRVHIKDSSDEDEFDE